MIDRLWDNGLEAWCTDSADLARLRATSKALRAVITMEDVQAAWRKERVWLLQPSKKPVVQHVGYGDQVQKWIKMIGPANQNNVGLWDEKEKAFLAMGRRHRRWPDRAQIILYCEETPDTLTPVGLFPGQTDTGVYLVIYLVWCRDIEDWLWHERVAQWNDEPIRTEVVRRVRAWIHEAPWTRD